MSQPTALQRFVRELRRRHVPQTAAVYLVAAWAAIQFADVVVPNLNGPQWVITTVIVAALVGLPVVLVLAWVFDWGPDGLHRTDEADGEPAAGRPVSSPVVAVAAVLVVGIGSALAVAALLTGDEPDAAAGSGASEGELSEDRFRDLPRVPGAPGSHPSRRPELVVPGSAESISGRLERAMRDAEALEGLDWRALEGLAFPGMDSLDVDELVSLGTAIAAESDLPILLRQPAQWRLNGRAALPLTRGDTLVMEGVAMDSMGVVSVRVDGHLVAESAEPRDALAFTARVVGTGNAGIRRIPVVVHTADQRELRRTYSVIQQPGASP